MLRFYRAMKGQGTSGTRLRQLSSNGEQGSPGRTYSQKRTEITIVWLSRTLETKTLLFSIFLASYIVSTMLTSDL